VFTNLEEDDLNEVEYKEYKVFKEQRNEINEEKINRDIGRTYRTSAFF